MRAVLSSVCVVVFFLAQLKPRSRRAFRMENDKNMLLVFASCSLRSLQLLLERAIHIYRYVICCPVLLLSRSAFPELTRLSANASAM